MISTKNFRKFRMENVVTEIPTALDYMQEVYYRHPDGKLTLYIGRHDGTAQAVSEGQGQQGNPGPGLPAGGNFGDIPVKTGAEDYQIGWTDQPIVDKLRFDELANESVIRGEMAWDAAERTMKIGTSSSGGSVLQVGQELHYPLCRNTNGFIYKGQAVMINPAGTVTGDHFNIVPMDASGAQPRMMFLGIAYEDIEVGELGIVSAFGRINDVALENVKPSEQTWVSGQILYCHPSQNGFLTNVPPVAPAHAIPVAVVIQVTGQNCKLIIRTFTP